MSTDETGQATYGARHWASTYIAYSAGLVLTACSYLTNAFGLHEHGLTAGVLLGVPLVTPLIALLVFRGGYRLVALGILLAAPVLWLSFFLLTFAGGLFYQ